MTRTLSSTASHHTVRIGMVLVLALAAYFAFASIAHADDKAYSSGAPGRQSGNQNAKFDSYAHNNGLGDAGGKTGGVFSSAELDSIMDRIADLETKKQELLNKLNKQREGGTSSSTVRDHNNSGQGNFKDRFCKGEGAAGLSKDVRNRICDRWINHSSSTSDGARPNCEQASGVFVNGKCERRATTTATLKLQHPNGGTAYKHPIDGAVIIKWRNTTKDKTVDIDLKKGSTTTSIAKNVSGKRVDANMQGGRPGAKDGDVLGANDSAGGGQRGPSDTGVKLLGGLFDNSNGKPNGMNAGPVYGYRWKDAPVGDGYIIVITAKDGDKTYTDESDKSFSVKKNPRGMNWYETDAATNGDVLGAAVSAEEQTSDVLNYLEDTLVEMSVALSS